MDDGELDRLSLAAGATTAVRTVTLDRLVERAARRRHGRGRRPVVLGAVVAGTVLLAAAASSAAWMGLPPFQSVADGMYRSKAAIPVDFTTTSGLEVRCEAFLEYTGLSVAQAHEVEASVARSDWSGLGQRLYDEGAPARESYEHAQDRVYTALDPVLRQAATAAVPGVRPRGSSDPGAARVSGWSIDCRRAAE